MWQGEMCNFFLAVVMQDLAIFCAREAKAACRKLPLSSLLCVDTPHFSRALSHKLFRIEFEQMNRISALSC